VIGEPLEGIPASSAVTPPSAGVELRARAKTCWWCLSLAAL